MAEYKLNHTIPRFLLEKFILPKTHSVLCIDKCSKEVKQKNIEKQSELFNIKHFYSKKSINFLLTIRPDIILNPKFKYPEEILEVNLNRCIEDPFRSVLNKIIKNPLVSELTEEDIEVMREYVFIQFIRTKRYKEDMQYLSDKLEILSTKEISEKIVESCRKNSQNPTNRINVYNHEVINEARKIRMKLSDYWKNPETHSIEIISQQNRNAFYKLTDLNDKKIHVLINNHDVPFILPDTGIVTVEFLDSGERIREIYVPLTPKICLKLCNECGISCNIQEKDIVEINKLAVEESAKAVFSNRNIEL